LVATVKDIDFKLIESCRNNERFALERIYELYAKALFNTCCRIVDNEADAEDLMQESFIEAFRKIDTYRGEGEFAGWLKRIAVNHSINFLRKRKRLVSLDEGYVEIPDNQPEDESISENIFCRIEEIRDALSRLNHQYKIILSLHLLEGYDHEEIASILGTTYGNVRTRYSRAKQKLLAIIMGARN